MEKRFVCDSMLGRLCRLLRACGIDTGYCSRSSEILLIARKEHRIALTKNTKLRDRHGVFFVEPNDPGQQLLMVNKRYRLNAGKNKKLFSRCLECNKELEPVDKLKIRDRVPFYTYIHNSLFVVCPQCQRVYWPGSHCKNMLDKLFGLEITRETVKQIH
jgi:uncharacterized protein with PIN domain